MNEPQEYASNRRFFRIDDTVHLTWTETTEAEIKRTLKIMEALPGDVFALSSTFEAINQDTKVLRKRVQATHPYVTRYFDVIEKKIDLLARAMMPSQEDLDPSKVVDVSLSAGGMGFPSSVEIETGAVLEMKIMLLPALIGIKVGGRVLRCDPTNQDIGWPFFAAVEFEFIRDCDCQILVKHALARQSGALRRRASGA